MIVVKLKVGEFLMVIKTDSELHPDVLDEMVTRCVRLFLETQAGLPNGGGDDDAESGPGT